MNEQNNTQVGAKKPTSMWNLGARGWKVSIFQIVWFFFMTGLTVDGLNVIVPQIAELRGWDSDVVLSISTPASIIALFLIVFSGGIAKKFGLKKTMVTTIFLAGIATILYGWSANIAMYAVCLVAMVTLISAYSINLGMSICTNWFPTKKGFIMGLTTIGMNLASALINQILNFFSNMLNISWALTIMGCIQILVGVLTMLFIKATPEEEGCYPDNDPEVARILAEQSANTPVSSATYADALKDPKVWIFGVAFGFFGLSTLGVMSQLSSFLMDTRGYELQASLNTITIVAVIGIIGSLIWGVVDQKVGTRVTCILFGIWYALGIVLILSGNTIVYIIGLVMLGAGIGGNGNFPPSMTALVFGRDKFPIYYSVVATITGVVRSLSFATLAILRATTSGYTIPYIVFAVIALIGGLIFIFVKAKPAVDYNVGATGDK